MSFFLLNDLDKPVKDEELGAYRCKRCGTLVFEAALLCEDCKGKRRAFLKKHWWVWVVLAVILLGLVYVFE